MNAVDDKQRKDAIKGLINIAFFEGVILVAVVGVYLYTNNIVHLVGGVIGSVLIFGPMFARWFREHRGEITVKPAGTENSDRR